MKIAMLGQKGIPANQCGVAQWVEIMSRRLVARGHEVVAYCRRSYCGRDARSTREGGLHRLFRPSIPTKHLDAITHTAFSTIDIALRRADVVHYHCVGPALLAPLARLARLPVVVTVHGLDWQRAKWGRLARASLKAGEWTAVRCANRVAVVSPILKQYYRDTYGIEADFVPNGVTAFEDTGSEQLARWNLQAGKYVLAVARLVPEKGLHYLIEAFCRTKTDLKLVIAGGGRFDDGYEARLRGLADDRVVFTGIADRSLLGQLYAGTRLFVLPSDLEGMSVALLEAMNAGLPVLVSDIPENACVVEDAGFTFARGDVDDLTRQLERLLADEQLLDAYGRRARRHAAAYQWPRIADQMERIYAQCAGIALPSRDHSPADQLDVNESCMPTAAELEEVGAAR